MKIIAAFRKSFSVTFVSTAFFIALVGASFIVSIHVDRDMVDEVLLKLVEFNVAAAVGLGALTIATITKNNNQRLFSNEIIIILLAGLLSLIIAFFDSETTGVIGFQRIYILFNSLLMTGTLYNVAIRNILDDEERK